MLIALNSRSNKCIYACIHHAISCPNCCTYMYRHHLTWNCPNFMNVSATLEIGIIYTLKIAVTFIFKMVTFIYNATFE